MDIHDRVMGDQPNSIFHKIAGIIPGYKGYVDRERRRDADKLLRMHLARLYTSQRDRLNRAQQSLLRARQLKSIGEVDRLVGVLQRFIDRLSTATYGYTGLFDPVKIEAQQLDQLYAFDMSLAGGVDQVSAAIDSIERADPDELPTSISRLSTVLDDLNRRLDQRTDLLSTGRLVPQDEYQSLMGNLNQTMTQTDQGSEIGGQGSDAGGYGSGFGGSTGGGVGGGEGSGDRARVTGGNAAIGADTGTPTTNLNMTANMPPGPGMAQMTEGNTGFADMQSGGGMNPDQPGHMALGGSAGTGIESASSPAQAPGAPGHDIVDGLGMANNMGTPVDNTGGKTS